MTHLEKPIRHNIDKKHVTAMALFVMTNVPGTDEFTLRKFLELMNTTGGFGTITGEQLRDIMKLMIKHIPKTCVYSLNVLIEHLGLYFPLNEKSDDESWLTGKKKSRTVKSGSKATPEPFQNGGQRNDKGQGLLQGNSQKRQG